MSERARQLVDELRNFRTRSQVMEELLMLGDDAVPELIQALGHPMENVRWSAQQLLTQLGGDTVVERLAEALDDPTRQKEAADTLRQITGQSIGVDRQAWATWLQSRGGTHAAPVREAAPTPRSAASGAAAPSPPPAPSSTQGLADDAIIRAATAGAEIDVRQHSGGYVLTVPLEGNRRQRVTVSFTAQDFEDEDLVVVYTECGPAQQKNFEWALRQNLRMSFGAIAIRDRGGQPTFVMVNTHPRKTLDVEELRKSIVLLASKGDKLEQALTKDDER